MTDKPELDEIFFVLANEHRRRLLDDLLEHNSQVGTDFHHRADEPIDEGELDRLNIEMIHIHLPKLEEMDFIWWDKATLTVRRGPRFDEIRPLLELMDNHADELPVDWP
jgi:hypothetical protein